MKLKSRPRRFNTDATQEKKLVYLMRYGAKGYHSDYWRQGLTFQLDTRSQTREEPDSTLKIFKFYYS